MVHCPMATDERESHLPSSAELSVGLQLGSECVSAWLQLTHYDGSGPGPGVFITIFNLILTIILRRRAKEPRLYSPPVQKFLIVPLFYRRGSGLREAEHVLTESWRSQISHPGLLNAKASVSGNY